MRIVAIFGLLFAGVGSGSLWAQHSARDAFWSASDLVSVSANPGARAASQNAVVKRKPQVVDVKTPHVDPNLISQNGYGEQPHIVRVSSEQIGMRYSVMLKDSAGKFNEVSPTAVFHSGDSLHLSVMANEPGYLYVIQQGTSGNWSPIYPQKGSKPESNKVESGKVVEIPAGGSFTFDTTPGQEKLFILVSRSPIQDLDSTISGLKTPGGPTNPKPTKPDMSIYEASNRIPDELVKGFASRDLTFVQDVNDPKKADGSGGEKAVYVVSKGIASSAGPQVVAALTLRHE